MDFEATWGAHTYTTPGWPLAVQAVSPVLLLVLVLAVLALTWRWERRSPLGAGVTLVAVGTILFLPVLAPFIGWSLSGDPADPFTATGRTLPWRLLGGVVLLELGAWVTAAAVATGLGAWLAFVFPDRPARLPLWVAALGASLLLLLPAGLGLGHATWLMSLGRLPTLEWDGPDRIHVGRSVDVAPTLGTTVHPQRWTIGPPAHLEPTTPGSHHLTLTAQGGPVRVSRTLELTAGEERADPALPLRVGNRWVWERTVRSRNRYLFGIIGSRDETAHHAGTLEVTGVEERDGLRVWTLGWRPDSAPRATELEVYAFDGRTLELSSGDPLVHHGADGQCAFALFDGSCTCDAPRPTTQEIPAPTWCDTRKGGGAEDAVASGVVAILTAGLLIPGSRRDESVQLSSSTAGPDGAASSP